MKHLTRNVVRNNCLLLRQMLECLSEIFILQSGDIAKHLDLVSHNVRTRLDELKRQELERLRNIVRMQIRQRNGKYTLYTHLERA